MKTYVPWMVCCLHLTVATFCNAAVFTPVPLNCGMVDSSPVTNLDKRMEVSVAAFSVLPPQGENWCVKSLASKGLSFLKAPASLPVFGKPSSPDELLPMALEAFRFTGLAVDVPDFGFNIESPEKLKFAVDEMIRTHIFSQFIMGIISAERRYQLLESHSATDMSSGVSCVRFNAKVEARGLHTGPPGLIMILNFFNNLVCAHPEPASSENRLIWISIIEAYRVGEESVVETVRREVDPFLQSLQFMPPR
ncbi:MAG TPA: hypothetical protein VI585_01755 [Candidatus Binatia bacterium]